ncbi:MAG: type 1 glutamine amidotransferase [Psychromonas sp.]
MNVHFIIHEAFEAPGVYEKWAKEKGYGISFSRVYEGEPLPQNSDKLDLLIVMGGPQSPSTTIEECAHFDARSEMATIQQFIAGHKLVIGVCLGAQLIGEALGAKTENSPHKEIGSYPITLTEEGSSNESFAHFPRTVSVGHWHGDMPGLTSESTTLAYSEGCPRQIVQYSEFVYGLQCHMEFTPEVVDLLIEASQEELDNLSGGRFIQSPDKLRANNYSEMNNLLYGFLDRLVERYMLIRGSSSALE